MATWKLSAYQKKNAVERQFWTKDGRTVIREEGYRWGAFYCESEDRPDVDLANPDGYELGDSEYDWELDHLDDGCWADWTYPNDMTEQEQQQLEAAWEEDYFDGLEALGWSCDDTEYHFFGPLVLTNETTGEEFLGESDEPQEKTEEQLVAELDEIVASMPEENSEVTDWFSKDINPVRTGTYEVINEDSPAVWPFPYSVTTAEWNGTNWNSTVKNWRGLLHNPAQ